MPSHYETLDIPRDATPEQIKSAYRKAASANHPDKGGSAEAMQAVNKANDVLSDPEKRARYDETGLDDGELTLAEKAAQLFPSLLRGALLQSGPLLHNMRKMLEQQEEGFAEDRDNNLANKAKLKQRLGRFKRKAKGKPNVIQEVIEQEITSINQQLAHFPEAVAMVKELTKLVNDYDSDEPPPEPVSLRGSGRSLADLMGLYGSKGTFNV